VALTDLGDYDRALATLSEGLALAEKVGDDAIIPRIRNTIGWLLIDCGAMARGIECSERAYEETNRSSRAGHGTGAERSAFIRINEGDAWMAQGDFASAAQALEQALHTVQHPPPSRWMTWRYSAHCYASLGQLALLKGDPERARRLADQCLETAVPTQSRKYESWAWRIKGESATARRAWGEAEDALGRARALAEAIAQPRQTWMSHLAIGRLDAAKGRRENAREAYRTAWSIIAGLRECTHDAALRTGLESLPLTREVEDLARPE
jgi:tetratricopeptide (TPR) repeat protein